MIFNEKIVNLGIDKEEIRKFLEDYWKVVW